MKSLLAFELNKIFRQKSIYAVYVVLLGLIMISLNAQYVVGKSASYKDWEGELTREKYKQAEADHAELTKNTNENTVWTEEMRERAGVYEEIAVAKRLDETNDMSIQYFQSNLPQLEEKTFEHRKEALHLRMLENVNVNKLYYHKAPAEMIDFVRTFGTMLTGALLLIGLAPIFSNEYMTGMDQLQLSTRHGRRKGIYAKIAAALIYTAFVIGVWSVFNLIQRILVYGDGGWSAPLQQLFQYRYSPYDFDMLTFIFVQLGIHALGAVGFALLVLLISAWCRHTILSILVSGAIFSLPIAIVVFFKIDLGMYENILDFTYTNVMRVTDLFDRFEVLNLFGYPVLYAYAAIVVMAVLSIAATRLLLYTMKRREVA
jgi:ABC-type transport system involved in multi-copper enzyme maturation permease subunit